MNYSRMLLLLLSLVCLNAFAQERTDILGICRDKNVPKDLIIFDQGFCAEFLNMTSETELKKTLANLKSDINSSLGNCPQINVSDKWKIRFYASHSFTTYFNTDVKFTSSRYNVEIKDYEWAERSSREFFEPKTWKEEGNNPFQVIDEPTNTFVMSIEKNGHEFFLSAFHPKFLQAKDQVKYMKGSIDGVEVDGFLEINKPFDGYDQVPGESELVRNQNTHRQMIFEIGYGYRFTLLKGRLGSINYVPSVGIGVMTGNNLSVMVKQGEWWEFEDHQDDFGIQGFGGSLTNRIEINGPKERFGIFYENKLGFYKQDHGFMDGNQKYNLGLVGNSVGMKFMIRNPNNAKKKKITYSPTEYFN